MNARSKLFAPSDGQWQVVAAVAAALVIASAFVPLWRMELVAPQYPLGLTMQAYGYKFVEDPKTTYDDIAEINQLNHYIGMKPIVEVTEMKLFLPGIGALVAGTVAATFATWQRRWLRRLVVAGYWTLPIFFVADLQYWLYDYGHTMDPNAALNTGAITPKVVGTTKVWNFHSENSLALGFYFLVAAALAITFLPPLVRWIQAGDPKARRRHARARDDAPAWHSGGRALVWIGVAGLALAAVGMQQTASAGAQAPDGGPSLQQRIDHARPGDTIVVDGGLFTEQIAIDKPLTLIGRRGTVIDGQGRGDVVTIIASDVTLTGFIVRNAGHAVTREPAGVKVVSAMRVNVRWNEVRDSRFGVYLLDSHEVLVEHNVIDLGRSVPVQQRGHGLYVWNSGHSALRNNTIVNAGDGIHLEFSNANVVADNEVSASRYGLHFMYAHENKVLRNVFRDNLAGAVLMFSHDAILKDNELSRNRKGATGTGLLLKDVDNLFAEGNRLLRNRYGMTAEGTPQSRGASAVFLRNLFALNDTGLGLMSNAPITFIENSMVENSVQVKALGARVASALLSSHAPATREAAPSPGAGRDHSHAASPASSPATNAAELPRLTLWSAAGRGNYWSDYRGYDADGDGVGDRPYRPRPPFAGALANQDDLKLFLFTMAQQAIDTAADLFPVYKYGPVIEDANPLMRPPTGFDSVQVEPEGVDWAMAGLSASLIAGAAVALSASTGFWPSTRTPRRVPASPGASLRG